MNYRCVRRRLAAIHSVAVLAAALAGCLPPFAGLTHAGEPSLIPSIRQLRIGVYPSYTRIVLETSTQLEWSLRNENGWCPRLVIPEGRLARGIRPRTLRRGIIKSVRPLQQPGGVEVQLACSQRDPRVRAFMLSDPDRIVVDVFVPALDKQRPPPPSEPVASLLLPGRDGAATTARPSAPTTAKELAPAGGAMDATSPARSAESGRQPPPLPPDRNDAGASGQFTVVLDPGHGGHDTGAIGPGGLLEKDVVLDLALRLRRLLRGRLGARVILTRTEDVFVPLADRAVVANRAKADFFISLHLNGSNKRGAMGSETYYFTREPSDNDARASAQRENLVLDKEGTGNDQDLLRITLADMAVTRDIRESSELAELALASLDKVLKMENRGVKSGPFYVLATVGMPAVLVESAFITNPKEEQELRRETYRQRIAEALLEAIGKYKLRYERRVGLRGGAWAGS